MLDDINAFRTGGDAWYWNSSDSQKIQTGKLSPLAYSYDLEKVAMQRAAEIALTFEHTRPDGSSCFTAADDLHVNPGTYRGETSPPDIPAPKAFTSAGARMTTLTRDRDTGGICWAISPT